MQLDPILSAAASGDFARYRPQSVIEAVNALLPLGKEGALEAIKFLSGPPEFAGRCPGRAVSGSARPVRDAGRARHQPPLRLGASSPAPPSSPRLLPLFPLVLIDDRPLMLVSGFALGGDAEPVIEHLRYFRITGTLRARPLAPSGSLNSVINQFRRLYQRAYGTSPSQRELAFIDAQLAQSN